MEACSKKFSMVIFSCGPVSGLIQVNHCSDYDFHLNAVHNETFMISIFNEIGLNFFLEKL